MMEDEKAFLLEFHTSIEAKVRIPFAELAKVLEIDITGISDDDVIQKLSNAIGDSFAIETLVRQHQSEWQVESEDFDLDDWNDV